MAILPYLVGSFVVAAPPLSPGPSVPVPDASPEGLTWSRFHTTDPLGRTITFYLSPAPPQPAPLAVFIQGSGCESLWTHLPTGHLGGTYQTVLQAAAHHRLRVLAVEKPGVPFAQRTDHPGSAESCSAEFKEEHTLPRWAAAVEAAISAALELPGVVSKPLVVVGHSEGGIVAARVAADMSAVTHVASLAGGGPTQLFDLIALDRAEPLPDLTGEQRAEKDLQAWEAIRADPDSATQMWKGHPFRRWSSFLAESTAGNLLRTRARIYLAHGSEDRNSSVATFDMALAELLAQGKDVTAERVEGADHSFRTHPGGGPPVEMEALFERILRWALP